MIIIYCVDLRKDAKNIRTWRTSMERLKFLIKGWNKNSRLYFVVHRSDDKYCGL